MYLCMELLKNKHKFKKCSVVEHLVRDLEAVCSTYV